jgi:hypothetical protein
MFSQTYKYTAVIIEPRKHKALEFVLKNALDNLNASWKILLFHGTKNKEFCEEIQKTLQSNRLELLALDVEDLNQVTYSEVLATKSIVYDHIHTEYFLIFQTDSMIFPEYKDLIYNFIHMGVDYVGAPWMICNYQPTKVRNFIGNGGMSLRKTATMKKIIELHPWNSKHEWHEDLFFTKPYADVPCKKPPYEMALTFCVDEVFSPVSFGAHKAWCHKHYDELVKIHPELETLRSLQGVVVQ